MRSMPIRVLQILGQVNNGGVEAVVMNYYRHIDKTKIQFDFVMHKGSNQKYIAEVQSLGAKVYLITSYTSNVIAFTYEIYRIIKNGHYSIVHSNMNSLSFFPMFAAWMAGSKVRILHNHTTDTPNERLRTVLKRVLRPFARIFANQYWACSKLAAEWMYGKKAVEYNSVKIINNAIDLKKYTFSIEKRKALQKELGVNGKFVVGHVGRFVKQKNHEFLIDVFAEVVKQKNNAVLLLIGEGPLFSAIKNKVTKLCLQDKVLFLGVRNDVNSLYNVMDVFVLPSFYEGLPVVGVEVQANGLPLLCSNNVTKEIIFTKYVKLLKLNDGIAKWANEITSISKRNNDFYSSVKDCRYDIHIEARRLEAMYEKIVT